MDGLLRTVRTRTAALSGALTLLTLAACGGGGGGGYGGGTSGGTGGGGGYGGGGTGTGAGGSAYAATALVSNGIVAAKTRDTTLVNPWGISFAPAQLVWTANNGSQTSTLYDGNGQKNALTVAFPAGANGPANPTGIVFNSGTGFVIEGGNAAPAQFIFAGEAGTITAWSDAIDPHNAITEYDDRAGGAVYKGLAIASDSAGNPRLYAADFHNGKIDEFDSSFAKITLGATAFVDPELPAGYAPFNIQAITLNGATLLYIAYAKPQAPANKDPVSGAGLGIIDVFDTQGALKTHLVAPGGKLDAPWGVALAPANFGTFSGDLLVGNFGDGWINAYDPASGAFKGTLSDANSQPIAISGLWGIAFGNGADSQPTTTLFFAAGPDNEADGVYGRIDLAK